MQELGEWDPLLIYVAWDKDQDPRTIDFAHAGSPSPRHRAGTQTDRKIGKWISLHYLTYARVQEHVWHIRGMSGSCVLYQSSMGEHP